ncbi:MAG: Rrf2 family transcriptional regulator [Coriobacteriia bacterium]|nr:Rrf2 family transcriptional regulator [Coriobacteriia bacterium]
MSITKRTDYAVRLIYELAQIPEGASLSIRDLCGMADVPENFGASLVPFLIEAGMVSAEGYHDHLLSLSQPAAEITMARIIKSCEPDFSLSQCTRNPASCNRSSHCGVHVMWKDLDQIVLNHLGQLTLADVVANHRPPLAVDSSCGMTDFARTLNGT